MIKKILFCLLLLTVYAAPAFAWPVPDTGQTKCYDDTGNEITCPNPGEPFYGQDASYSINTRSYTKLDANGIDLPDTVASWTMVRDNVTRLIWEVKTLRNRDDTYFVGEPISDVHVQIFIDELNAENYGGYSDWRMPTVKELDSITDKGGYGPAVDTDYFPNTVSGEYWSSTEDLLGNLWFVYFDYGHHALSDDSITTPFGENSDRFYVRAVRGGQPEPYDHLLLNGDGTVTDKSTGLMWQQEIGGEMNWKDALAYCGNLSLAGYGDWRLPTVEELKSIVQLNYGLLDNLLLNMMYFSDTLVTGHWSSTTDAELPDSAWYVDFDDGRDYISKKSESYHARAVRGGQSVPIDNLMISLAADRTNGVVPFQGIFSATVESGNPPYTFLYDFGDGSSGSGQQDVVHAYDHPGAYTVTVTVTDAEEQAATRSLTIAVAEPAHINQAPTASIMTDTTRGTAPFKVQFTGLGTDPEGHTLVYLWDFGDGRTGQGMAIDHTYTTPGVHAATLTVTDSGGLSGMATTNITVDEPDVPEPDPSNDSIGKAIVITGGGAHSNNTLFDISTEQCQSMYRLLKQRGYTDTDIAYMTPLGWQDINGDGRDNKVVDYQLFDPQAELTAAFTAAGQALSTNSGQFVLYLHGHARPGWLKMTKEFELSAQALGDLLALLPRGTQQIIILDTCYSGSFMDHLSGAEGRTVITSADETAAWNTIHDSFSETFIRELKRGHDLKHAFRSAEDMIMGDPGLFGAQQPQLDDNGDGLYTSQDGPRIAGVHIGKEGFQAADLPMVTSVHPRMELGENQASATLWVKTSPSHDGIKKVRAILIRPSFQPSLYQGEDTEFGREEIELIYNAAQDRYEIVYDGFREAGAWRVLYQAKGMDGDWSEMAYGAVSSSGVNAPAIVEAGLNQPVYQTGDTLRFDISVNGNIPVDLYAVLMFPQEYFVSISYPLNISLPGTIVPYREGVELTGLKTFQVMDIVLPPGLGAGKYTCYGLAVQPGSDPRNQENWINIDSKSFDLQ